jgi:hypothetical protein
MRLNLPILDQLADRENILIAGAGGGFDIFAGLPIYFTLRGMGKTVHLANYSFTEFAIAGLISQVEIIMDDLLIATRGHVKFPFGYLPEPYLADWFREQRGEDIPIYMLGNTGAIPLMQAYRKLVSLLNIDAIILVDGGVDSIMRGNEVGAGTLLEDTLTLIAVDRLPVPVKIIACIGFGTEVEEQVCHYNALENMAALVKAGGFYGSCALTPQMEVFKLYEEACRYVWDKPEHHRSHISTRIIPAVYGEFGNYHEFQPKKEVDVLLSPLMSLYWFFNASTVLRQNTLVEVLCTTQTKMEAMHVVSKHIHTLTEIRPRRPLPY